VITKLRPSRAKFERGKKKQILTQRLITDWEVLNTIKLRQKEIPSKLPCNSLTQAGRKGRLYFFLFTYFYSIIVPCSPSNRNVGYPHSVLLYNEFDICAHSRALSLSVYTVYFVLAPIPRTFSFWCRIGTGGACSRKSANDDKQRATGSVTLSLVVPPSCTANSSKSTRRPGRRRG